MHALLCPFAHKQAPYTEADFTTNVDPSFAFKGPYGV